MLSHTISNRLIGLHYFSLFLIFYSTFNFWFYVLISLLRRFSTLPRILLFFPEFFFFAATTHHHHPPNPTLIPTYIFFAFFIIISFVNTTYTLHKKKKIYIKLHIFFIIGFCLRLVPIFARKRQGIGAA